MKLIHKLIAMGLLGVATVAMADDASPVLQSVQASQTSKQGGGQIRWVKKPKLSTLNASSFSSDPELCFAIDIPLFQHCNYELRTTAKMLINPDGSVAKAYVNTGSKGFDRNIIRELRRSKLTPHDRQDGLMVHYPIVFKIDTQQSIITQVWQVELLRGRCAQVNNISQCDPAKLEAEFRRLGVDQLSNESTSQN